MINKLKNIISKNSSFYVLSKAIMCFRDEEFQNLIKAYYHHQCTDIILKIKICGDKNKNQIFYIINEGDKEYSDLGFWALVRETIRYLYFAEELSLVPYVLWGRYVLYYDKDFIQTDNVFEYYFEPVVKDVSYEDILQSRNVVYRKYQDNQMFIQCYGSGLSYQIDKNEIDVMAQVYKKYFHLNQSTKSYIDSNMKQMIGSKKTLGVHVRGTDYKLQWKNHPHFSGFQIFIDECEKALKQNSYEQIFLATDDDEALQLFKSRYGKKLVYYTDIQRGNGNEGIHVSHMDRELHHYKLGLEVLRDVYTLTACAGLITGLSQVSFAARYVKKAKGEKYEWESVVQMEINKKGIETGKNSNEYRKNN